jgi:hypothetical protein
LILTTKTMTGYKTSSPAPCLIREGRQNSEIDSIAPDNVTNISRVRLYSSLPFTLMRFRAARHVIQLHQARNGERSYRESIEVYTQYATAHKLIFL